MISRASTGCDYGPDRVHQAVTKTALFAMLLEAQHRGWKIHYGGLQRYVATRRPGVRPPYQSASLQTSSGEVVSNSEKWRTARLGDMDVILMRKDPPFDMEYIVATYVLRASRRTWRGGGQPATRV